MSIVLPFNSSLSYSLCQMRAPDERETYNNNVICIIGPTAVTVAISVLWIQIQVHHSFFYANDNDVDGI